MLPWARETQVFSCLFVVTDSGDQDLFLALHLEIPPRRLLGSYGVLRIKPGLTSCNASTLFTILSGSKGNSVFLGKSRINFHHILFYILPLLFLNHVYELFHGVKDARGLQPCTHHCGIVYSSILLDCHALPKIVAYLKIQWIQFLCSKEGKVALSSYGLSGNEKIISISNLGRI